MVKCILTILIILFPFFSTAQQGSNREDSALYKLVKKIRLAIEDRRDKAIRASSSFLSRRIVTDSGVAVIDSLYKYQIKGVKSIYINLDRNPLTSGTMAHWGIMRIFGKDDDEEEKGLPSFLFSAQEKMWGEDSALYRMVKKIRLAIEDRVKDANAIRYYWPPTVLLDSGVVHIDSLYKYHINDIAKISIHFDYDPLIYGSMAYWGIIKVCRREDAAKIDSEEN